MKGHTQSVRWMLTAACLLLAVNSVWSQTDGGLRVGRPGRTSITSADRRFLVSGMTSAENMVLAGQLADLAQRIEEKTGMPLPMRQGQLLGVMVQSAAAPDTQILKMQGWDDGRIYQRLVVPGRHRLDGEDMMEAAGWLLLNRYAAEYTPSPQRTGMGAGVPEWISAGVVQNTQASLRSRNRDWIDRELADGRSMKLADVVKLEVMPTGRWREKAYAAAAVDFLFPDRDITAWATMFKAAGTRQAIDPSWLKKNCSALAGQHPEAAWREHLAGGARARTIEAWSDRGMQLEERLLETLNFRPRDLVAGVPDDVPLELYARDLAGYRQQDWAAPLAAALSLRVQALKLGAPPTLQEALACYAAYFDQFGTPPAEKTSWWRKKRTDPKKLLPPDDATWQVALNQLWLRAERAHQAYLERTQSRKRYIDSFDKPAPGEFDPVPTTVYDIPRTRAQSYLDEIEERRSREAFY